jgi:hypothetical protein
MKYAKRIGAVLRRHGIDSRAKLRAMFDKRASFLGLTGIGPKFDEELQTMLRELGPGEWEEAMGMPWEAPR